MKLNGEILRQVKSSGDVEEGQGASVKMYVVKGECEVSPNTT